MIVEPIMNLFFLVRISETVHIKLHIFLANKLLWILVKHHVFESSIKSLVFAPVGRRTTMSVSRNFTYLHNGRNRLFAQFFQCVLMTLYHNLP